MSVAPLELEAVQLHGRRPAFSLMVPAGSVTVVLGGSGSGKSRLCRAIAGLEAFVSGVIRIDGDDVTPRPARERPVALVFQSFVNYPNLNVFDNIASPLRAAGATKTDIDVTVRGIADQVQLGDLLTRYPAELSGGQQQRLAIARALAQRPRVLVLDEPLVNLDYNLRDALRREIRRLSTERGMAVLYTSNDAREAFALADQVVLLDEGACIQQGGTLDVYRAPVSPAAAELMSDPGLNCWRANGRTHYLRPEHVRWGDADDGDVRFSGTVTACELNGGETYLHCDVEGLPWVAKRDGLHPVADGAVIELSARRGNVLEFGV